MPIYYTTDDKGKITQSADWKFSDDCRESEQNILHGHDGQLYFEDEAPTRPAATTQERIDAQESQITPRRVREAVLGMRESADFIADIDAQIAQLRTNQKDTK